MQTCRQKNIKLGGEKDSCREWVEVIEICIRLSFIKEHSFPVNFLQTIQNIIIIINH